jgi:ferritin-like metal-binding protein YciE
MSVTEQLESYLSDAQSIEQQALVQLRVAPDIAGDPALAEIFRHHLTDTEHHERLVRERLEAYGGRPSAIKEAVMKAGGAAFVLFARSQRDTPGKLTAHAYSYEHLELAAYELLGVIARLAGDDTTAEIARRIGDEERGMAGRLEGAFDIAVQASLRGIEPSDLDQQLHKYLADAHAIENQALKLLEKGPRLAGDRELERIYAEHLEETEGHIRLVAERLHAKGGGPSRLKDAAMRLGALNWGAFFAAQPDTPGKLAAFAFAFEHLEIAGYELLRRVAQRAGDEETVWLAERIVGEERAAAGQVAAAFGKAAEASLEAVGAARW